ncbi:MAG TPA: hypothetical protein VEC76_01080 [Streptosporangiaceae bacterium]|nr:hypothetical protein [Streptosporangiaceae bacterium]
MVPDVLRSPGPGPPEVQRSVHPCLSRQYHRMSAQALPPSATIWSVDRRIPHIQQDLTVSGPPRPGVKRA